MPWKPYKPDDPDLALRTLEGLILKQREVLDNGDVIETYGQPMYWEDEEDEKQL